MSYLCRIAEPYRALVAEERRSGSGLYHVDGHGDVIRELWGVAKDRKRSGPLESPFLEPHKEEPLHFVEPRVWWRRDHFRRRSHSRTPADPQGTLDAHQWVQWQLAELGASWGMTAKLEEVVVRGRCDVTWREPGIAWEVDLTPKSATDLRLRNERRAAAGWTVISVVDSILCRDVDLEDPAVHVYKLRSRAKRAVAGMAGKRGFFRGLGTIYTQRLHGLTDETAWDKVPALDFRLFVRELLLGSWVYSDFSRIREVGGYGWALAEDLEKARMIDRGLRMQSEQRTERLAEIERECVQKGQAREDVKRQLQSIWAGAPALGCKIESGGWIRRELRRLWRRKAQARIEDDYARRRAAAEPLECEKQQIEAQLSRLSKESAHLRSLNIPETCLPEPIWTSAQLRPIALPALSADRARSRTRG